MEIFKNTEKERKNNLTKKKKKELTNKDESAAHK